MNKLFLLLTCAVAQTSLNASQVAQTKITPQKYASISEEVCKFVLVMSNLGDGNSSPSLEQTYQQLDAFFKKYNIKDYTDAAQFGRTHTIFAHADTFNQTMGNLFKSNGIDIYPQQPRKYQAIIFNSSGIDVFMERLAFVKRLVTAHALQTDELIALIGSHAHRQDLMNYEYLINLPGLFTSDFDRTAFNKDAISKTVCRALQDIEELCTKQHWTHRDGMEIAWNLVACDADMAQLKSKFRYFSGNGSASLRTEQLLEQLIANGLKNPISPENPIAFVCNSQGASKTVEMIRKYFSDHMDAVDVLIARPAAEEIEAKLFNDMPQQRAMTKLFHFYRILEIKKDSQSRCEKNGCFPGCSCP